ncbi:MAG: PEP-CTERM sorting domain-containing protein [Phycisphaerales bacterium]
MKKHMLIGAGALLAAAGIANAGAFSLDGIVDGGYGTALTVQNTPTGFGDSNLGEPLFANGSELNAAYGTISGGVLYLTLTGNLESNFNKLEIFIDNKAGGQNKLRGDNADVDFNGLNRMGDDGSGNGLTFDAGFEADHYITVTGGNTGSGYQLFASYAELLSGGGGTGAFVGGSPVGSGVISGGFGGLELAINNSNTAGVTGDMVIDPASVSTGVELAIPLSLLGGFTGEVRISAFINGGGHDFLANQVLGGVNGAGNLGEPRNVNFGNIDGDQFFVVVPTPGAMALFCLAGVGAARRRRA